MLLLLGERLHKLLRSDVRQSLQFDVRQLVGEVRGRRAHLGEVDHLRMGGRMVGDGVRMVVVLVRVDVVGGGVGAALHATQVLFVLV